jgi:hypothetical protein
MTANTHTASGTRAPVPVDPAVSAYMRGLSAKAAAARRVQVTPARRQAIARKAARARWAAVRKARRVEAMERAVRVAGELAGEVVTDNNQ